MPFNQALFWFGLTAFATGLYYLWEPTVKRLHSAGLTVLGVLACAYTVYRDSHPELPTVHLWVILLVFTWALLGYNIYIRRFHRLPPPPAVKPKEPSKLVIHRAVYAAGLATEVSVTEQLQNLVREGIAITVDPTLGNLLPSDPASGIRKRLDVEYSYGSDTRFPVSRIERPAGEIMRLVLPEDTEVKRLASEVEKVTQANTKLEQESLGWKGKYLAENIEKTNFQKELARAENRATELQARLPALRPRIVGVRYGLQSRDNRAGLFLTNEGEPAYDVTIPDVVQFGTSKLAFHTKSIGRLTKSDGEFLCDAWIERESHSNLLGNGLFDEMVSQRIDAIEVPIRYKDGDNRYYVTQCQIERNVSVDGGIAVRYIGQKMEGPVSIASAAASAEPLDKALDRIVSTLTKPHLEILSPLMHGEVGLYRVVRGSVYPPNSEMQVLVWASEWWYLQGGAQVDGLAWSKECKFGLDKPNYGGDYKIVALLGKSVTESRIRELPDAPKSDEIRVRRTHDGGRMAV